MYKYEMDPTKAVGATERTWDAGRTDGQTDGRSETSIPPNNFVVRGGYNNFDLLQPVRFQSLTGWALHNNTLQLCKFCYVPRYCCIFLWLCGLNEIHTGIYSTPTRLMFLTRYMWSSLRTDSHIYVQTFISLSVVIKSNLFAASFITNESHGCANATPLVGYTRRIKLIAAEFILKYW